MNNNLRLKPKLIDINLLNKVNKIYINKSSGNHFILDWIYKTLYPCFRDNLLFSIVVFGLIGYLLYRYIENIKKKNKIISNINDEKPIEIELKKPINYTVENMEEKSEKLEISLSNTLSEINKNEKNIDLPFSKDIERDLKIGQNNNKQPKSNTRNSLILKQQPQEKPQQHQQQHQSQNQTQQQTHHQQQSQQYPEDEYVSNSLLEPNMPFEVLEQNMNRMKGRNADPNIQQKCSNYRIPTTNEPMGLNSFSDNFYQF